MKQAWQLMQAAINGWAEDFAPSMGAALSYYMLFSIAPLLIIVIANAGFFSAPTQCEAKCSRNCPGSWARRARARVAVRSVL